jgi:hypothetical protein
VSAKHKVLISPLLAGSIDNRATKTGYLKGIDNNFNSEILYTTKLRLSKCKNSESLDIGNTSCFE